MSFCFQSFNYLPGINCCLSRDTRKKSHAVGKLTASVIPKAEEINSPADTKRSSFSNKHSTERNFSGTLTDQANGIGIIGGLLVDSSLNFAKNLNSYLHDEESELPFVLCTDPSLSKELLSVERSALPFVSGKTKRIHVDHSLIVESLRRKRVFLENSGVCCIVMPCHVLNSWHDEIKEGCSVPFLHMGECVAKELKEAKLRPIEAGSPVRIGVLATNATLVARMYQEKLEKEGFEAIMPDKATMEHTVIPAMEALSTKDIEGAENLFRIALQVLLVKAVNKIIIASDELRQLLPPDDPLWKKCIDPIDALARSTIEYYQSAGRGK